MKEPLISVIVPIYKVEKYLHQCVDSLLCQTYQNLEIILVDDGSPDGCPAICDEYAAQDDRIKVIHKKNGGASDARNAGLKIMNGGFVCFVDGDDFAADDLVQTLYDLLITNRGDISCVQFMRFYGGKALPQLTDSVECEILNPHDALQKMMYFDGVEPSPFCKLYKSYLFHGIQYPVGKVLGEDLETTYKLFLRAARIVNSHAQKYYYLQRTGSTENSPFTLAKMDLLETCKNLRDDVLAVYPDLCKAWYCRFFCANFHLFFQIPKGRFAEQANLLKKNIKACRRGVLLDRHARRKAQAAALLSYLGLDFTRGVWSLKKIQDWY